MTFRRTRCPHCAKKLEAGQRIHIECIEPWADAQQARREREEAKKVRMAAKVERATTRARKQALKRIPDLIKEAQHACNAFIRERDRIAGHSCISSGRALDWSGNGVDAGHFRSVGSASHLRFDERNIHAQSKHDNQWKAGNVVQYRINLIQRIGLPAVEALEADNHTHHWTREELIEIRETYKAKLKAMKEAT